MRRFASWLLNPTFLALLGLAIVAVIIFFVGPLIAIASWRPLESLAARLVLIGLIFAAWLLLRLWRWWRHRATNAALLKQLAKDDPAAIAAAGPRGAEEVAELRKRFESALATLRKSSSTSGRTGVFSGFGRRYVYQMPWYVFIGAPGSGKTTALINSGLEFPLADKYGKSGIRGIGGTRNCDWWFTNEAVLIDTAGRYTTQESDLQQDKAEWEGFLGLLRSYRPRAPINGVLLTISVSDLLGSSSDEREKQASAIRRRLTELQDLLGIRFPVYAIVTKVDLLAGFNEYFSRLSQEERNQVWGLTFPSRDDGQPTQELAPTFQAEYRLLETRIENGLPDLLQGEHDVQRRALIYAFTQHFAGLRDVLGKFLETLFTESKFAQPPLVRGVYFTSGTQEGAPFDRVLGSIQRRFGIEARVQATTGGQSTGKSYFLKDLLQRLVFAEAYLVERNPARERRQRILQIAGIATCLVALIAAAVAWTVSYSNNSAYLAEVGPKVSVLAKQVAAAPNTTSDFVALLPILNDARDLAESNEFSIDHPPFDYRAGLYQGNKVRTAAEAAYDRLLENLLLPRVAMRLSKLLQDAPQDNLEAQYERLKAYLMLHETDHYNPDYLLGAVSRDWQTSLGQTLTNEAQQQLTGHLRQLLNGRVRQSPFARDTALVDKARERLGRYTQAQRVYGQLKGSLDRSGSADFNLVSVIGPDAQNVFARASGKRLEEGVSDFYTRNGYRQLQERLNDRRLLLLDETWVLGAPGRSATSKLTDAFDERLLNDIRVLYLNDYRRAWDVYLADLRLVPASDRESSIRLLRALTSGDPPLPKFIKAVADETTLAETGQRAAGLADRVTDAAKAAASRVAGSTLAQGGSSAGDSNRPGQIEPKYVDSFFVEWRRLAAPPTAGGSDTLKPLLTQLYNDLVAAEAAFRANNVPAQTDTANRIRAEAGRLPIPLRGMLEDLVNTSASQTSDATRDKINEKVNAAVGNACRNYVKGRYPFTKTSNADVAPDDFEKLFAPGGLFDKFFQENLTQLVDTSKKSWTFRPNVDGTAAGGSASLASFQNAAAIRDAFFRTGGRTPQIRLSITVKNLDRAIKELTLDVGGQLLKQIGGEADRSKNFVWPALDGNTELRLQADAGPALEFKGAWALHRLFDKATITPGATPDRFTAVVNLGERAVTLEVSASVQNPFSLPELRAFSCPGRL